MYRWHPVPKRLECCSGVDNPEMAKYKAQFDLVFIDNGIGTPGCDFPFTGGNDTMLDCHLHRSQGAARIKAVDSQKPVFVYRQISAVLEGANVSALSEAGLFITHDDRGNAVAPGILDWRLSAAQDWYVDHVFGDHTAVDTNFDGVFMDGPLVCLSLTG